MQKIIPFLLMLLIVTACEKQPQYQHPNLDKTRYFGTIEYNLPTIHQTTVCSRRFTADSVRWWDVPSVIVPYQFAADCYFIVDATIRSTPNCIDSSFLIHNGLGRIVGDSLFESGTAEYICYIGAVKTTEQGTWSAKFKKQP